MDLQKNEEPVISIRELIDILFQHAQLLLAFIVIFFCLGLIFVFFRTPVFQSTALLKISSESNGNDSILSKIAGITQSDPYFADAQLDSEKYILISKPVMEDAVKQANLDIIASPFYFPYIGKAIANWRTNFQNLSQVKSSWFGLARYNWGGGYIHVSQLVLPSNLYGHVFTLKYDGNNQYDLFYQEKRVLHGTVGVLANGLVNNEPITLLVSEIAANANARFMLLRQSMAAAVTMLQGQVSVARVGVTTDLLMINATGPYDQQLQSRLSAVLDSAIRTSIQFRVQKAKKILSFLEHQVPAMKDHLDSLNQAMNNTFPMGVQFSNMAREKGIQNLMYTNILMDIEQYELQKASSLGKIGIIMLPTDMALFMKFSGLASIIFFVFSGFFLGSLYIFSRHYIFGIVYSMDQIERITGLPAMGCVQISKEQITQRQLYEKSRIIHLSLLFEKNENDIALEGFRNLRTNLFLNYLADGQKNKTIAICGSIPNIGKSFIAVNLAQQLAYMQKKVLLIDADIRKGSIWEYFCDRRPNTGFVDLLKNLDAHNVVRNTHIKNLDFVPSGELNVRNIELLLKNRIEIILKRFSEEYDCIVIDTAPVFAISDALVICRHSDINLLTFAYGKHNEKDVDNLMKKFENNNIKLHGFIMNMVVLSALGYKYGYYYYRYGGYHYKAREKESA